jgi:hypothetical protein
VDGANHRHRRLLSHFCPARDSTTVRIARPEAGRAWPRIPCQKDLEVGPVSGDCTACGGPNTRFP